MTRCWRHAYAPPLPMPELDQTANFIADLDQLVGALLVAVPAARPGQRQLRRDCIEAERLLQVLRMAIAMNRSADELAKTACELLDSLRLANAHVAAARVDMGTRQAIKLSGQLAQHVLRGVTAAKPTAI